MNRLSKTSLFQVTEQEQEIWHDDLYRTLISSGGLAKMVKIDGLSGVTSNPTIFDEAINNDDSYDEEISQLAKQGKTAEEIYTALTIEDIRQACDVLKPVYESSLGGKGYVSLEVNPNFAYEAEKTVNDVQRIVKLVGRENVMIKVPGTHIGVEAIQKLIAQGFNINVTLLFSVKHYERIAWAYIKGLGERAANGQDLGRVRSVASFFLSRIDRVIDPEIDKLTKEIAEQEKKKALKNLRGKPAISVAKLTYDRFQKIFASSEFLKLKEKGAKIQKPLWASMSTKDPTYNDVKYVEALIFPNTVCTMPMVTAKAFRDHGQVEIADLDSESEAKVLSDLENYGIDVDYYLEKLQTDGVQSFIDSYEHLLETIDNKKKALLHK